MADQRDAVELITEAISTNLKTAPKGRPMKKEITLPAEAAREFAKDHGAVFVEAVEQAIASGMDALRFYAEPDGTGGYDIAVAEPTGIMVSLMVPAYLRDLLAIPGGEPAEDLHVTLNYLGDAAEMSLNEQRRLIGTVGEIVRETRKLKGTLGGTGRFSNGEDLDPFWVGVSVPGLTALQARLHKALTEAGFSPRADFGAYTPHVTVAYIPADAETPALDYAPVEVEFCDVTVAIGGQRLAMALLPDEEQEDLFTRSPEGWVPEAITKSVDTVEEERYTLGPWYIPDMLDAHGEWTDRREIQKSFHRYLAREDRDIRLQHDTSIIAGRWVDGMVMPEPYTTTLTKADGGTTQHTFPAGTPFLGVRWEPWAWDLIKAGKLRGYSIGGSSDRIEVDLER